MARIDSIAWLGGALGQLVNELTARVPLPVPGLEPAPPGEVAEPPGPSGRAGAQAVERLLDAVLGRRAADTPTAARRARPLLRAARVTVTGDAGTSRLRLDLRTSGVDWQRAGSTGVPLAVYVDGRYAGTVVATGERGPRYVLNVGHLAAGPHEVEVRAAQALPAGATVDVSSLAPVAVDAQTALVDRYAPVIEYRSSTEPGAVRRARFDTDLPAFVAPLVSRDAQGRTTIEYRVAFSNEDGGTRTDLLLERYGRTIDIEPLYRVVLAPDGTTVLDRSYATPVHRWRRFDGELDGERALLRVSSSNNLVSARVTTGGGDRWIEAPGAPVTATTSDLRLMVDRPWSWALMGKELLREGKGDARRYLYLGPLDDAARAAVLATGCVRLRLADGRTTSVRVDPSFARRTTRTGTAVELPPGTLVDAITGVVGLHLDAVVLDARFGARLLRTVA